MRLAVQKVRFVGLRKHAKVLLKELHQKGVMHLTENKQFTSTASPSDDQVSQTLFDAYDTARIDFAIRFLSPFAQGKGTLNTILTGGKLILPEREAEDRFMRFAVQMDGVITQCERLEEQLVKNANEIKRLEARKTEIWPLRELAMAVDAGTKTTATQTFIVRVPAQEIDAFIAGLAQKTSLVDIQPLGTEGRTAYLRLTLALTVVEDVQKLMTEFAVEVVDIANAFADFAGKTPAEIMTAIDAKVVELQSSLLEAENKRQELTVHLEDLQIAYDYSAWRQNKNLASEKLLKTANLFALEGWMEESKMADIQKWLKNAFVNEVIVESIEPAEDEVQPTLIRNGLGFESFQMLTEMYGVPKKEEADPTSVIAVCFALFFGICLSDVGYGMLLTLVAAPLLIWGKFTRTARTPIITLLISGIMAVIGGVLLGGWFGMTLEEAPSFLVAGDHFIGQILNPGVGEGPLQFLIFSFGVGVVHLLLGTVLLGVKEWKNGNKFDAFADAFLWVYTLVMLLLWALSDMIGLPKTVFMYLLFAGIIGIVLTGGRKKDGIVAKALFGVFSLYTAVDYLSAMLSYSRLMALGLATGIIAFAMNLTGQVLGEMLPGILGILVMVAFLLFGHSLNFALSMLGAFVHSMRLQFIEFFGRFYEGGAPVFKPFRRAKRYLVFEREVVK